MRIRGPSLPTFCGAPWRRQHQRPGSHRPRGYILAEVAVVVAISSVLLAAAIPTLLILIRTSHAARDWLQETQSWERFRLALQADLHQADSVLLKEDSDDNRPLDRPLIRIAWQSAGESTTVEYSTEPRRIVRKIHVADQPVRTQTFPSPRLEPQFSKLVVRDGLVELAVSLTQRKGETRASTVDTFPEDWSMVAELGRDRRRMEQIVEQLKPSEDAP